MDAIKFSVNRGIQAKTAKKYGNHKENKND